MKWMGLLLELANVKPNQRKGKHELLGYAIVRMNGLTGKKFWQAYDGDGKNEVSYSAGQPLSFPLDNIQVGVKIELFTPGE